MAKQIKKNKQAIKNEGMDDVKYLQAVRLAAISNSQLQIDGREFGMAIQRLKRLTNSLHDNATSHYLLGEAYRKQNNQANLESSIDAYQKAVAIKPNFSEPWRELGMAYRRQGQVAKAKEASEKYLSLRPEAEDAPIINWYQKNLAAQAMKK
ncbi:MAG: Flp pilus assembly protein TadD [Arenicella sp.]